MDGFGEDWIEGGKEAEGKGEERRREREKEVERGSRNDDILKVHVKKLVTFLTTFCTKFLLPQLLHYYYKKQQLIIIILLLSLLLLVLIYGKNYSNVNKHNSTY